jgi:Tfp pilus assembly protein PilF
MERLICARRTIKPARKVAAILETRRPWQSSSGVLGHASLGQLFWEKGDLARAEAEFREAIGIDPRIASIHQNLGTIYQIKGERILAEAEFRHALRIDPMMVFAHANLGLLLAENWEYDEAAQEFKEAIRLAQKTRVPPSIIAQLQLDLATILWSKQDKDAALVAYRTAVTIDPKNAETHARLGAALLELGDLDGAGVTFQEALRYAPKKVKYSQSLKQAEL